MSSVVYIDPAGRRDMDRDYLDLDAEAPPLRGRGLAQVVNFTSRLERGGLCTRCGQEGHRVTRCPQKPQKT